MTIRGIYNVSGIYKITNVVTGLFYIGSAVNVDSRWRTHMANLNNNKHANKYLQSSWNKHGGENFEFSILEILDRSKLVEREQYYLDNTKCFDREIGYNLRPTANSQLGMKLPQTEEHRRNIGLGNKGKKRSLETRINNSNAQKGKKLSEAHKKKVSDGLLGRVQSLKTRNKIAEAHRNKEKWPHGNSRCPCQRCLDLRYFMRRGERKRKPIFVTKMFIKDESGIYV